MVYDKLVRDKIPKLYESEGKICVTEELEMEQFANKLLETLDSEIESFKKAFNAEDDELAVKKIADSVEVFYAILDLIGVTKKSFEKIRLAKCNKFGGFEGRILLKEIVDKK